MLVFFCAFPLWGKTELLNGTAAIVGKVLIKIQDAYFYQDLQEFLREEKSNTPSSEISDQLKKVIQKMVFEEMVYIEIKSFQFSEVNRSQAVALVAKRKKKKGRSKWKKLLIKYHRTEKQASDIVWKSMQVERFVKKKVETMTPIITDAEVERERQRCGPLFFVRSPYSIFFLVISRLKRNLGLNLHLMGPQKFGEFSPKIRLSQKLSHLFGH